MRNLKEHLRYLSACEKHDKSAFALEESPKCDACLTILVHEILDEKMDDLIAYFYEEE